jgi:YopX protein
MTREIKFRYTYGIEDKPETYFSRVFTLDQIESGDQFDEISDSPLLRDYSILFRDQRSGRKDKHGDDIYENDTVVGMWSGVIVFEDCHFAVRTMNNSRIYLHVDVFGTKPEFEITGNTHKDT